SAKGRPFAERKATITPGTGMSRPLQTCLHVAARGGPAGSSPFLFFPRPSPTRSRTRVRQDLSVVADRHPPQHLPGRLVDQEPDAAVTEAHVGPARVRRLDRLVPAAPVRHAIVVVLPPLHADGPAQRDRRAGGEATPAALLRRRRVLLGAQPDPV